MDTKTPAQTLRTPEQVLAWFRADGISIAGWCREHGLDRNTVNALLYGRTNGLRGKSHRAAVALGIKAAPEQAQAGGTNE